MSATSLTTIFRLALSMLKEAPITDADEDRAPATFCRQAWPIVRDATLRAHPWSFAKERVQLADVEPNPPHPWKYWYQIPAHWVVSVPPTYEGTRHGRPLPYEIFGTRIAVNVNPLYLTGIRREENTAIYDPLFTHAAAAKLAATIAGAVTGKRSSVETAIVAYRGFLQEARLADSIEGGDDTSTGDSWVDSRFLPPTH